MKRVVLSIGLTVVGVVALLSFKTRGTIDSPGALPAATLPPALPRSTPAAPPVGSSAPPDPASTAAIRGAGQVYLGAAEHTPYGVVQVEAKLTGRRITDVSFVQLTAFDPRSQQINTAAAPTLLQETLSAQSAKIDSVSGATYTSTGYVQSLQSALDRAGR